MKRLTAALLTAALLILTACGGSAESSAPESTVPETAAPSPAVTPTPEPEPTPEPQRGFSISIETMTGIRTVDKFDVASFSYEYPQIVISGSADGENYDELKAWAQEMFTSAEATAQNVLQEAEDTYRISPLNFASPYFYTRTLEKAVAADELVVIIENTSMYLGGAHPGHSQYAWVISGDGRLLTLEDLGDADAIINAAAGDILGQIKALKLGDQLFPDYVDAVADGIMDGTWYLSEDGFTVIYPEYSIAPYSAGSFEFTVGYGVLDGIISSDYVLATAENN